MAPMAKIPPSVSLRALPIKSALQEGRTQEAKRLILTHLRDGTADQVIQGLAADLIEAKPKARGGQKTLPEYWYEISEDYRYLRSDGNTRRASIDHLLKKWGYSETHLRNCLKIRDRAEDDSARE